LRLSLRHLREHAEAELIGNDEGTVRQPRERLRRLRAGCFIRMRKAGGETKLAHVPAQCGKLLNQSRFVNPPAGASLVIGRYCEHELAGPGPAPHPRSGSIQLSSEFERPITSRTSAEPQIRAAAPQSRGFSGAIHSAQ